MKHRITREYALLLLHLPCLAFVLGVLLRLLWPLNLSTMEGFAVIVVCGAIFSAVISTLLARRGKSILTAAGIMMVFLLICLFVSCTPLFRVLTKVVYTITKHGHGEAIAFYLLFTELYCGGALLGMPLGYLAAKLTKKKN